MRNYLHAVRLFKPPFFNLINIMVLGALSISCSSIDNNKTPNNAAITQSTTNIYGTTNDYAKEAIYFLMTDRFVDGDPSNNHENQGGEYPTFDRPLVGKNGETANVGYLGGDFQGVIITHNILKIWALPLCG